MGKANNRSITDIEAKDIVKLAGGPDEALFLLEWVKQGLNATKAYQALHPDVTYQSAKTLGYRMFTKVYQLNKDLILQAYDLGHDRYYQQLSDGLRADKIDNFSGEKYPDHVARKPYHDKLGKILGIETEQANVTNILVMPSELISKYGVSSNTEDSSSGQS